MSPEELEVERARKRDYMRRKASSRSPEEREVSLAKKRAAYTPRLRPTVEARFWQKVEMGAEPGGCWRWKGSLASSGYGRLATPGCYALAHRYSYELHNGPIPDGLHIDHLCRNRGCVNPAHLEPVTPRVNNLRGVGLAAIHAAKKACPRCGSEYTKASKKGRYCKPCRYRQIAEWAAKFPEKRAAMARRYAAKQRLDQVMNWRVGTASRRTAELVRIHLIERTATMRPTRTGSQAFVFEVIR